MVCWKMDNILGPLCTCCKYAVFKIDKQAAFSPTSWDKVDKID